MEKGNVLDNSSKLLALVILEPTFTKYVKALTNFTGFLESLYPSIFLKGARAAICSAAVIL